MSRDIERIVRKTFSPEANQYLFQPAMLTRGAQMLVFLDQLKVYCDGSQIAVYQRCDDRGLRRFQDEHTAVARYNNESCLADVCHP